MGVVPVCAVAENGVVTVPAAGRTSSADSASSASASYQPETQFAFFVDRLAFVNLYSTPTEMAKFTSYCA